MHQASKRKQADDLMKRNFKADKPLQKCVAASCIQTGEHRMPVSCTAMQETNTAILQSMNRAGGGCHDNARCESMWARLKEELLYNRHDTKKMIARY